MNLSMGDAMTEVSENVQAVLKNGQCHCRRWYRGHQKIAPIEVTQQLAAFKQSRILNWNLVGHAMEEYG